MAAAGVWPRHTWRPMLLVLLAAACGPGGTCPAAGTPASGGASLPSTDDGRAGRTLAPGRHLPRLASRIVQRRRRGLSTSRSLEEGSSSSTADPVYKEQLVWMPEVPVKEEPTVETEGGDVEEESLARLFK